MTNTALSAKAEQIAQNVTFRNEEHKKFFLTYLPKCRYGDVYHAALVYCLRIDADTRRNIKAAAVMIIQSMTWITGSWMAAYMTIQV